MSDPNGKSWRANMITSRWRAVGGKLRVDAGAVIFEPHGFDRATGAQPWSAGFAEVQAVEVAPRRPSSHMFGAGLRRQLSS